MAEPIMIFGCTITRENGVTMIRPESSTALNHTVVTTPKKRCRDGSKLAQAVDVLREIFTGRSSLSRTEIIVAEQNHGITSGTMADARKYLDIVSKDGQWIWPDK